MTARIHRGANEVGGNCIELEADGKRIVLNIGYPITASDGEEVALPDVAGLKGGDDPTLLGVVISHPHPDHFGLLPKVAPSVPVYSRFWAIRSPCSLGSRAKARWTRPLFLRSH